VSEHRGATRARTATRARRHPRAPRSATRQCWTRAREMRVSIHC